MLQSDKEKLEGCVNCGADCNFCGMPHYTEVEVIEFISFLLPGKFPVEFVKERLEKFNVHKQR